MKLKAFDVEDILFESDIYINSMLGEIKEKIKPYVLYLKRDDCIGICLDDQKKDIVKILKEYGKLNLKGNFTNVDTFFINGDYCWDTIYLGNIEIEGESVWEEFSKLLKLNEDLLINAGNKFEEEWYRLQKIALRKVFDIELDIIKKGMDDAEKSFEHHIGIHETI